MRGERGGREGRRIVGHEPSARGAAVGVQETPQCCRAAKTATFDCRENGREALGHGAAHQLGENPQATLGGRELAGDSREDGPARCAGDAKLTLVRRGGAVLQEARRYSGRGVSRTLLGWRETSRRQEDRCDSDMCVSVGSAGLLSPLHPPPAAQRRARRRGAAHHLQNRRRGLQMPETAHHFPRID